MKANEFVKIFGWSKAKEVSSFTSNVCEDPTHFDSDLDIYVHFDDFKGVMDESDVCIHDIKRLVESHNLVSTCGGIESLKEQLTHSLYESKAVRERLEIAVLDVEGCL